MWWDGLKLESVGFFVTRAIHGEFVDSRRNEPINEGFLGVFFDTLLYVVEHENKHVHVGS